jgi:hypothetical protein
MLPRNGYYTDQQTNRRDGEAYETAMLTDIHFGKKANSSVHSQDGVEYVSSGSAITLELILPSIMLVSRRLAKIGAEYFDTYVCIWGLWLLNNRYAYSVHSNQQPRSVSGTVVMFTPLYTSKSFLNFHHG